MADSRSVYVTGGVDIDSAAGGNSNHPPILADLVCLSLDADIQEFVG
jgi:hypothetical protein